MEAFAAVGRSYTQRPQAGRWGPKWKRCGAAGSRFCIPDLQEANIGALIIGIGFWGIFFYHDNKETS